MRRRERIERLRQDRPFDLLVIGGGATGCGIAVDAATRGLATALVERFDFCEGTSSRSTKLVHGGVRYLEAAVKHFDRAQFTLVRDALRERGAFLANAPHLSRPLAMVTPIYSWLEVPYLYAGLKLYDLLSGRMNIGHSRLIGASEAKKRFPHLKTQGLKAAVVYYDGQFIDTRMGLALALTAEHAGAAIANHVAVVRLIHEGSRLAGAELEDRLTGERWEVRAKAIINAAGPFADGIRRLDDPAARPILKTSAGVHILLDGRFVPGDAGLLVPKTDDGRVLFILPWQGHALVGTTDTESPPLEHPVVSEADIDYLLDYVRRYTDLPVSRQDVRAAWAGVRPLVFDPDAKDTAALARDHVIIEDRSGLLTISGGKWTTYRLMAEQAVDRAAAQAGLTAIQSRTAQMQVWGATAFSKDGARELAVRFGLASDIADHLHRTYGDVAPAVATLANEERRGERLHPDHPYIEAEVIHALRSEAAERAADVLCRRLTLALVDTDAAMATLPCVVSLMAEELGWDEARKEQEADAAAARLAEAL
ncbi:FAD-dependent oxidoreductase [Consotaella salsifontis]|uniref:Glycerol-3-phosphate dehydrogenase n=1 Tax=Consotaella salsifontis TaxID=1365950 RepID=A0A1T4SIJ1_9HYPH|nr:FAD-dependent oxidoreductase [Consotaella salsifontis]SKA28032.1 glycerol-3-phosphate dehydrogenase [Consotaella salsifontis]